MVFTIVRSSVHANCLKLLCKLFPCCLVMWVYKTCYFKSLPTNSLLPLKLQFSCGKDLLCMVIPNYWSLFQVLRVHWGSWDKGYSLTILSAPKCCYEIWNFHLIYTLQKSMAYLWVITYVYIRDCLTFEVPSTLF